MIAAALVLALAGFGWWRMRKRPPASTLYDKYPKGESWKWDKQK